MVPSKTYNHDVSPTSDTRKCSNNHSTSESKHFINPIVLESLKMDTENLSSPKMACRSLEISISLASLELMECTTHWRMTDLVHWGSANWAALPWDDPDSVTPLQARRTTATRNLRMSILDTTKRRGVDLLTYRHCSNALSTVH